MSLSQGIADIFHDTFRDRVKVSKISPDLKGKSIVIYGDNNVGKTQQAANFKNPVFMPFEKGLNATGNALVLQNSNWVDVKTNIQKLTSKKMTNALKKSDEQVTIIWDGFERAGFYCQRFVEEKYDAFDIADAREGFGAWSQYEKEFWSEVDKLLGIGYTVLFIGHVDVGGNKSKPEQIYPKGDKRCVKPIIDNADIVTYIKANGVDSKGQEIPSSAYFVATDEYFARSRFTYIKDTIPVFTAENFEKVVVEGIQKELEVKGLQGVTFDEQQEIYKGEDVDYATLIEEIQEQYLILHEHKQGRVYEKAVEQYLGTGVRVSQTSPNQIQPLLCIKADLETAIEEIKEEVVNEQQEEVEVED